jgi:hypothetical protein
MWWEHREKKYRRRRVRSSIGNFFWSIVMGVIVLCILVVCVRGCGKYVNIMGTEIERSQQFK